MQTTSLESAPLTFDANQRRNVMGTHAQTAHVWAQGRYVSGRSSDGRMFFENGVIYSHGRHFAIARLSNHTWNGRRVVLWNNERYSVSTGKHQTHARRALLGLPYIVIQVLDYSAATLHAENIKKTLAGFARTGADSELQIFAAIAAPQLKLNTPTRRDAFRARIAREDAANEKAQAAETLRMLKHTWRHTKPAEYIADDYRIVPTLESANFNAYQAESRAREIERRLTNARSARLQFSKAGLPLYKKRTSDFVKFYAPIATAWRALESALDHTEQRSNRLAQMRSIIAAIQENKNDWRARDITFLEGAIHDAITYEQPDAIPPLMNRLHAVYFAKECGATEYAANPDMTGAWLRQTLGHKHKQVTPDDWRNGEGAASYYGSSETLVRRKGDRLETSRGAVAPFSQAVAIFVKAQQCRATGKAWAPNGERYRAGHFELDSIDATGGINIGCHRIEFGEMLRLAVREVPQMVRAAYPVPALV